MKKGCLPTLSHACLKLLHLSSHIISPPEDRADKEATSKEEMSNEFSSLCKLFSYILLVIQCSYICTAKEISGRNLNNNVAKSKQINDNDNHEGLHGMDMDSSVNLFFAPDDLKPSKTMPIYFPRRDPSTSPILLPREEADSIPFLSSQLPHLLQLFSFSKDSPQAKAMEYTLRQCELDPIRGENKFCSTSLEYMLDSIQNFFGLGKKIEVLTTTTHLTKSTSPLQNYTIWVMPKEISASKMIACHTMPYPYAVYYCHSQESWNRLFKVSLFGENGEKVDAIAACHMNTSQWDPSHVAFRVLGSQPGSPVCHFFPDNNLVWVLLSTSAN